MGWVKSSVFFVGKSIFLAQFCRDEKPRAFEARGFVQKYLHLMFRNRHIRIPFQHIAQL